MNRRSFLTALTGGGLAMAVPGSGAESKPAILELRLLKMRNTLDNMNQRTTDYLKNAYVPAMQRSGARSIGVFGSLIAQDSPFVMLLSSHSSLASWSASGDAIAADKELQKARDSYYGSGLGYVRAEVSLLKAFESIPDIEVPPAVQDQHSRIFELRTYESNNPATLRKKVNMFNSGEIAIFRKLNMRPVFFGETIVGRNMPNLTYMLAYDSLAAREKVWSAFGSDPDWAKLKSTPGLSDPEIVSNISNSILRPLPFSAIK